MPLHVWLITGGARGLGRGFTATLLQRSNTIVVAAVRDPRASTVDSLSSLPAADGSKLVVVKIDSESDTDPFEAVKALETEYGIHHIDVVIANAATVAPAGRVSTASVEDFRRDFNNNTMAPLLLFQATWPLLQKSASPTFVGISSCLATISKMEEWTWPTAAYGTSKAAMNYIVRKMQFEHESLIAFVVHPGWVQTDSGNRAAKAMGREEAPVTIESSASFILDKIDNAAGKGLSGTFQFYGQDEYFW